MNTIDEAAIRQIVADVLSRLSSEPPKEDGDIPVEVSARHVHLTQEDVEVLFGKGHTLTCKRELSQPGQFLAQERVDIVTSKGVLRGVAVLGPVRSNTQVELSLTDARLLGVDAPVRQSGDTHAGGSVCLLSEHAILNAEESVIIAQNHIHMSPKDAETFGVNDGQIVRIRMHTRRPLTFDSVVVRVSPNFRLAMHIDFDEANACAFLPGNRGQILR